MRLSKAQQSALAQRIVDQFESFLSSELSYQVEDMKDNDELDWGMIYLMRTQMISQTWL